MSSSSAEEGITTRRVIDVAGYEVEPGTLEEPKREHGSSGTAGESDQDSDEHGHGAPSGRSKPAQGGELLDRL